MLTRTRNTSISVIANSHGRWQALRQWRLSPRQGMAAAICAASFMVVGSSAADDRATCFSVNGANPALTVRGDVLRQALLAAANAKAVTDTALQPTTPPPSPKRCTGVNPSIPAAGPTSANYYGVLNTKTKFRRFAFKACAAAAPSDQYFSMGKAIYYRSCQGGAGNNYVYFWGNQNGNASACFGSTYPEMFTVANSVAAKPVTAAQLKSVYTGSGLSASEDQPTYALGNMMAAILIAEAARDYLVIPANYMLIDRAMANKITPAKIVGGHCATGAATCNNNASPRDGAHPLAWGGAQAVMMTGGFAGAGGATSDFGQAFENDLIVAWLKDNNKITAAAAGTCGVSTATFGSYTPVQQAALQAPFISVFSD